jgi:TRAP transporter TAXI family solute receptor
MRTLAIALAAACTMAGACVDGTPMHAESPRRILRMVKTVETTMSEPVARELARRMPDLEIQMVDGSGPGGSVSAIQRGDADVGFILADVAYLAQAEAARDRKHSAELRGIAALQTAPVHVLAQNGVRLPQIVELRHPRIGVNFAFSSQIVLANLVLRAYGLEDGASSLPLSASDLALALKEGSVDAAFVTSYYPARSVAEATRLGARLVPMDDTVAETLRRKYPFVRRVNIPANTYAGQSTSIRTIGVNRLFVCRSDLDDKLVHELTQHFIELLPRIIQPLRASARLMDLDSASATPIPLHKGAAQYYRERELAP